MACGHRQVNVHVKAAYHHRGEKVLLYIVSMSGGRNLAVSPVCRHAVCIFGHSGGQRRCVHDSDTVVTQCLSESN